MPNKTIRVCAYIFFFTGEEKVDVIKHDQNGIKQCYAESMLKYIYYFSLIILLPITKMKRAFL